MSPTWIIESLNLVQIFSVLPWWETNCCCSSTPLRLSIDLTAFLQVWLLLLPLLLSLSHTHTHSLTHSLCRKGGADVGEGSNLRHISSLIKKRTEDHWSFLLGPNVLHSKPSNLQLSPQHLSVICDLSELTETLMASGVLPVTDLTLTATKFLKNRGGSSKFCTK